MDDKVFLFIILIPCIILGASYYFMKAAKKGKKHFLILLSILIIIHVMFCIKLESENTSEYNLKRGVEWLVFLYAELLFLFFFALIYGFISLSKNSKQ